MYVCVSSRVSVCVSVRVVRQRVGGFWCVFSSHECAPCPVVSAYSNSLLYIRYSFVFIQERAEPEDLRSENVNVRAEAAGQRWNQ